MGTVSAPAVTHTVPAVAYTGHAGVYGYPHAYGGLYGYVGRKKRYAEATPEATPEADPEAEAAADAWYSYYGHGHGGYGGYYGRGYGGYGGYYGRGYGGYGGYGWGK